MSPATLRAASTSAAALAAAATAAASAAAATAAAVTAREARRRGGALHSGEGAGATVPLAEPSSSPGARTHHVHDRITVHSEV